MAEKISELEKAALTEKPWQLTGEVTAQTRPENSMLEEDVDFDHTSRMGMTPLCLAAGVQQKCSLHTQIILTQQPTLATDDSLSVLYLLYVCA